MQATKIQINEHGRRIGQSHPRAKLTDHEVGLVHELIETGMSYARIAEKMGVSKPCIGHIASGRRRCQMPVQWRIERGQNELPTVVTSPCPAGARLQSTLLAVWR